MICPTFVSTCGKHPSFSSTSNLQTRGVCSSSSSSSQYTFRVSKFTGKSMPVTKKPVVPEVACTNNHTNENKYVKSISPMTMLIDPWSVSPEAIDQLAAQFFASSLFPYIAFLYFMGRKETNCPKLANFGFRFLLVFVFATIPAGIYAKTVYGDILANIDILHGSAESLLTLTNLFIVVGFRQALSKLRPSSTNDNSEQSDEKQAMNLKLPIITSIIALGSILNLVGFHTEPSNALSLPTWMVHSSSLLEWLAAMGLVWEYAEVTGRPQWKGLVWGMLPLHTSGICACTYHLFYNSPSLNGLVALQAGLTAFGNAGLAYATWRIWKSSEANTGEDALPENNETKNSQDIISSSLAVKNNTPDSQYYSQLLVGTLLLSVFVKWGSLAVDFPFHPTWLAAALFILIPTGLNGLKWAIRSKTGKELFGGLL